MTTLSRPLGGLLGGGIVERILGADSSSLNSSQIVSLLAGVGETLGTPPAIAGWADQSGSGNNVSQATAANQPSAATIGGKNGVLFSGTDYLGLTTLNPHGFTAMTLSAWVYVTAYPSGPAEVVEIGNGSAWVGLTSNKFECLVFNGTTNKSFISTGAVPLTSWHKLDMTYDSSVAGGTLTGYIDGVSQGSTTATGIISWVDNSLNIGSKAGIAPITGYVGNCAIYNRALSAAEIAALFALGTN
jgi:hypothetical protein